MSKYYKADDAIRAIEEMQNCYNGWSDTYDKAEIIGVLEELPTIEIVRCHECEYYEDPNHKIFENCVKWKDSHGIILPIKPNDSCSYGERIDNE